MEAKEWLNGSMINKVYYLLIFISKYINISHALLTSKKKKPPWIIKSLTGKHIFSEWKATIKRQVFFIKYEKTFS